MAFARSCLLAVFACALAPAALAGKEEVQQAMLMSADLTDASQELRRFSAELERRQQKQAQQQELLQQQADRLGQLRHADEEQIVQLTRDLKNAGDVEAALQKRADEAEKKLRDAEKFVGATTQRLQESQVRLQKSEQNLQAMEKKLQVMSMRAEQAEASLKQSKESMQSERRMSESHQVLALQQANVERVELAQARVGMRRQQAIFEAQAQQAQRNLAGMQVKLNRAEAESAREAKQLELRLEETLKESTAAKAALQLQVEKRFNETARSVAEAKASESSLLHRAENAESAYRLDQERIEQMTEELAQAQAQLAQDGVVPYAAYPQAYAAATAYPQPSLLQRLRQPLM